MPTLSIVNSKGGVGKTTTAVMLCAAAFARGLPVKLVDADPLGGSSVWAQRASEHSDAFPWPTAVATNPNRVRHECEGNELVIIDTPTRNFPLIEASVEVADLVLVPAIPSFLDILATLPVLEMTGHKAVRVVLTQVDVREVLTRTAREEFVDAGAKVVDTDIPRCVDLARTYGYTPKRLFSYDDLFLELLQTNLLRISKQAAYAG